MGSLFIIFLFLFIFLSRFNWPVKESNPFEEEQEEREYALNNSICHIFAIVMMADGIATKTELAVIKEFFLRSFGEKKAKELLLLLRKCLKELDDPNTYRDVRLHCVRINQYLTYKQRLALLSTLFKISAADGTISQPEAVLLQQYARFTRIGDVDFEHLSNFYAHRYQWEYQSKTNNHQQGQQRQTRNSNNSTISDRASALKILGLEENATETEIKKAYRKAAMQYHPDKQVNATQEEIVKATEKFREINEAYDFLTK